VGVGVVGQPSPNPSLDKGGESEQHRIRTVLRNVGLQKWQEMSDYCYLKWVQTYENAVD